MENAENTISEPLDFKMFWTRLPPDPSYKLTPPVLVSSPPPPPPPPPHFHRGSVVPDYVNLVNRAAMGWARFLIYPWLIFLFFNRAAMGRTHGR